MGLLLACLVCLQLGMLAVLLRKERTPVRIRLLWAVCKVAA